MVYELIELGGEKRGQIEKIVINGMLPIFIKMAYNKVFKSDQLYNIRESVNGVEYLVNPIPQN